MESRVRSFYLVGLLTAVVAVALPASAGAYVYWPNDFSGTIGRANLDGSAVNQSLVVGGGGRTVGVAVDGSHIYWAHYAKDGTIGRSNLDGSEPEPNFITGADFPIGVAVDGSHVYWANNSGGTIGRADLNGSNVDQSFIAASTATGVAVDGSHVYWAENLGDKIGRAKLDGSEVEHSFITGVNHPYGVAVDSGHIYWTGEGDGSIGRANLSGTEPELNFIAPAPENEEEEEEEEIGGESRYGIAVDAGHIYWSNDSGAEIGRADLNGSAVDPSFIFPATAFGVAVDSGSPSASQPSTTTVACAPGQLTLPGAATCRATVSGVTAPTGAVAFSSSAAGAFAPATSCLLVAGSATEASCELTYTPAAAGSQAISAAYGGDEADSPSSDATTIQVSSLVPPLSPISPIVPSNAIVLAKPKYNKRAGTAALIVSVPGPGRLALSGPGIRKLTKFAKGAGKVTVAVKPSSKTLRTLKKTGKAKVIATITFTPTGGTPHAESKTLTLKG